MFDHVLGFILLGLGIQTPITSPTVKGDATESAIERRDTFLWLEPRRPRENDATRTGARDKHEAFRDTLRAQQAKFRLSFEEHKASAEASLQRKKEEFEEKLASFKDETRKSKLEHIQERLEEQNTKITQRATENLAKISELLDRIIEKIQDEKNNGKDTLAADAAIGAAQTAIVNAQQAIATQALKTYVVPITTENNARSETIALIKLMTSDAKIMHEAVVSARKTVSTVIRELAKVRGEPVPESVIK